MEPMSEMHVGEGVNIVSMCKTVSENNNDTNSMWLAQVIVEYAFSFYELSYIYVIAYIKRLDNFCYLF